MKEFKTVMRGKPATVEVKDDGSVQVLSRDVVWGFTPDLKPAFYDNGNGVIAYTFDAEGNASDTALLGNFQLRGNRPVKPNDSYLASFDDALKAIIAVPAQTPLPPELQAKLASQLAI